MGVQLLCQKEEHAGDQMQEAKRDKLRAGVAVLQESREPRISVSIMARVGKGSDTYFF